MASSAAKVVILTGASRGIGLATAHHLLQRSHNLVVVSRTRTALDQLSQQYPNQVEVLSADLSDFSFGPKAVDAAVKRWGQLDALIVNHGTLDPVKKVADLSAEDWRGAFDVNVFSAISFIQPAIPHLRKSHGRIILTSSGAAVNAYTGWAPYGAAKAVFNHLALSLSVEEPLITTISIRPGVVDTEMQHDIREKHSSFMDPKDSEKFKGLKESGTLLKPEQPGHVLARVAVNEGVGKELSGKFVNWNDESLKAFQEG